MIEALETGMAQITCGDVQEMVNARKRQSVCGIALRVVSYAFSPLLLTASRGGIQGALPEFPELPSKHL